MSAGTALEAGDALLAELRGGERSGSNAPTMGRLKRCSYTHEAMIELIIEHPEMNQGEIAAHFGYTQGWISNILASDAFQELMAKRRGEIIDPRLRATIEERFRALVIQSVERLQVLLEADNCPPQVALRAAELGAKALGVGGHAPAPKQESSEERLERLARRLVNLQSGVRERTVDGTVTEAELVPLPSPAR